MAENQSQKNNKWLKYLAIIGGIIIVFAVIAGGCIYFNLFAAPQTKAGTEQLTVPLSSETSDLTGLAKLLKDKGFIKNETGFRIAYLKTIGADIAISRLANTTCDDCFVLGAYKLSKSMDAWQIAKAIKDKPYMKWVVIPEGLRKEQIADILADQLSLNWSEKQKNDWITNFTAIKYDYLEGVYFPDTYLIPVDEKPLAVADRLRVHFEEKFAPYSKEALNKNVKWDTLLKIASIVQREAAGQNDMPLVSGIIWNRLLGGMKLEIDATVQYARDDIIHYGEARHDTQPLNYLSAGSWWTPLKAGDTDIASPYNTYRNKGLPPHPICNPGLSAIKAALNPAETECLYYLHDSDRQIHCSKTYKEHQANIAIYLK